jgi:hypothetical protein
MVFNATFNNISAALLRLQDTYKLDTEKIAAGDIAGIKTSQLSGKLNFIILKNNNIL